MKNFFHHGSFAKRMAFAALSCLGTAWRSRLRTTSLVLAAALFANSVGQDAAAQRAKRDSSPFSAGSINADAALIVAAAAVTLAGIGVGVYVVVQHAHTVKGCVSDSPDGLLLHTQDGKTFVLLGNTTNIKADTKIKVTGKRRNKIPGITDQPSFVVEKLDKVYGLCSVTP